MSQKTAGKIGLILLCIGITIGSVIGLISGIVLFFFTDVYEYCSLALIIGSVLLFIGAVYGIFKLTSIKIWVVVAFGSGALAVLVYVLGLAFGMSRISPWPYFTIVALLVALCLYSIFVLISSGRRREEKITNLISPTDDETNKSTEETIKKIEQSD